MSWCPGPESNRHDREVEGFSYHFDFRRQRERCSWSGARLHHSLAAVGARRLLSTPSHEPFDSGLGSALARTFAHPGRSPNLTGFTFGVSSGGLKFFKSLVSTNFTTRAGLPRYRVHFRTATAELALTVPLAWPLAGS